MMWLRINDCEIHILFGRDDSLDCCKYSILRCGHDAWLLLCVISAPNPYSIQDWPCGIIIIVLNNNFYYCLFQFSQTGHAYENSLRADTECTWMNMDTFKSFSAQRD